MSTRRPAGAVFHSCALQVNPHHYGKTFRGQASDGDTESHAEAILKRAAELDVSVMAITDHNSVSGVPVFRQFAESFGVTIFPGFELASSEGIHVLCIYPPDTGQEQLGRFLGEFGILGTEPSPDLSSHRFKDILDTVRKQRGVAIAAHATTNGGLLKVLSGQARINAWRDPDLLAIQIPGTVEDLPQNLREIVENKDQKYRRANPADERQAVAVVNAMDVIAPEDLDNRAATCSIKMSDVSIEGLRQAFLDPTSRIGLNPPAGAPETEAHPELVSLAWEGGFLGGVGISLNPNLNVLIGGRGAGKSTVIESLRYVLELDPVGGDAGKAHQGIVRQVLRSGTKISLRVRRHRPVRREYVIERTVPNPPVVRDEGGQVSNLNPNDILPRVEVYGQHEISELTSSKERLIRLLDRFVEPDHALTRRKADVQRELEKTRRALLDVSAEAGQIDERLATLPRLEETLLRYREAGLEERLRERSLLVREERVLDSIPERFAPLHGSLDNLRQELPLDRTFLSSRALEELPGREILATADAVFERLSNDLEEVARRFDDALQQAEAELADVRSRWGERRDAVQDAYERILRELRRGAVDGEEFIRLRSQIENLRPLQERRALLGRLHEEHLGRRRDLLTEWEELKAAEFRLLDQAARKIGRKLRNRVQVEVTAAGNREPLRQLLRVEVGGRLSEAIEALARVEGFSLPGFVASCRKGPAAVESLYSVTPAQAKRLAEAPEETLMRIEELELPSTPVIRLNTAPAGGPPSWQALDALSTGQKATAVLLLLLLESDAPLIVDQPEDDLDNRFITEGVVPRMRAEKRRRQFIFSTHNANIPVLGDAELILGLTASGEADDGEACIAPEHAGSIDAQSVRELVEELLEGGREAFEKRRLKYGF